MLNLLPNAMTSGQKSSKRGLKLMPFPGIEALTGTQHPHAIEVRNSSCYALAIDIRSREKFEDDYIPGAPHDEPITSTRTMPRKWLGTRSVGIV